MVFRSLARSGWLSPLLAAALVLLSLPAFSKPAIPTAPVASVANPLHKVGLQKSGDESAGTVLLRIGAEILGGALATAVLLVIGFLVVEGGDDIADQIVTALVLGVVLLAGSVLAVPAAIYGAGELAGGDSEYWPTVGGFAGGLVLGILVTVAFDGLSEGPWGVALTWVLAMAGGIIAYELLHEPESDGAADRALGLHDAGNSHAPRMPVVEGPFLVPPELGRGAVLGYSLGF